MRVHFPLVILQIFTFLIPSTHHESSAAASPPANHTAIISSNTSGEGDFAKRDFGEPCTCDNDCNFGKWLICQNGYCNCAKKSFVYDYSRLVCVVRLGEKCFEIAQEYIEYNPKDLPPTVRCIEGAFCSMSAGGVCACNTYGFYQSLDGTTCQRKKNYGQPCTRGLECKSDVCSGPEGKCTCNIGEFYHKRRKRCVSLVGAMCFGDDDCLDNGICLEHLAVCGCAPSYMETRSNTCEMRLNFGDTCSDQHPCNNPELACIDSACSCKYLGHQLFDNETGHCLSYPGGPCVETENCVRDSSCVQSGMFQECQCDEGFLEMPNGLCEKFSGQGDPCQGSDECDPVAGLVCLDGVCNCRDALTQYHKGTRKCRGLAGSRCQKEMEGSCTPNAFCSQPNSQLPGRCQCKDNFTVVTRDRTCVPP